MNSTKYVADYDTHGIVKIEEIIEPKYLEEAKTYRDLFKELTLSGNVTRSNRSEEDLQKDVEATELLKEMATGLNHPLAWGFMLYNEASITKIYWTQRVGKLRQDKREFFNRDKYLEWLTEIHAVLIKGHTKYTDPLYYYKLGKKSRAGEVVGDYDVMNSFRTHWNMYFLPILAMYLYAEDQKYNDYGISIDAALENENGAGNHLEAELARHVKSYTAEDQASFIAIENFLRSFTKAPLNQPIPLNTGAKAVGVTYREIMLSIVDGTWTSGKAAYEKFLIGPSIQAKVLQKIKFEMGKHGFSLEEFGRYLEDYRTTAIDILNGIDASFSFEDV